MIQVSSSSSSSNGLQVVVVVVEWMKSGIKAGKISVSSISLSITKLELLNCFIFKFF